MAARFLDQRAGLAAKLKNFFAAAGIGIDADDDSLKFKDNNGNVRTVVTTAQVQTLTNKTLTSPTINAPVVNGPSITGAPTSALGIGAVGGAGVTLASDVSPDGIIHHTVLVLGIAGPNKMTIADGADNTVGKLLYTFPAGHIVILGAHVDAALTLTGTFNANPADQMFLGVGTVDGTQAADGDLTTTEQNVIAKTTIDTVGGTDLDHLFQAMLSAPLNVDGTSAAGKLYLNAAGLNANATTAVDVALIGAFRFSWLCIGDYTAV